MSSELREKCEQLLQSLYRNEDHARLRRLIADIEALRDRLDAAAKADLATRRRRDPGKR